MGRKGLVICIAVLVLIGLYWTRYQVVQLSGVGGFYKINRLTGQITLIGGTLSQTVKNLAETRIELQRQQEMRQQGEAPAPAPQPQPPRK